MSRIIRQLSFLTIFGLFGTMLAAQELVQPDGEVILTISGAIQNTNADESAVFDLEMLRDLPAASISTTTIWTDGEQSFVGVELAALAALVGFDGTTLKASAVNDYSVDIPISDAVPGRAMIAYERNGTTMPLRDKGPLWIVFPFDAGTEFQRESIYARSIWQLNRIAVVK